MLVLKGNRQRVELVRFSPDGRSVVAPSYGGLQVWTDLATAGAPARLPRHRFPSNVAFAPDGSKLYSNHSDLLVHDFATNKSDAVPLWKDSHSCRFNLSPDGEHVAVSVTVGYAGQRVVWLACVPTANPTRASAVWIKQLDRDNYLHPQFVRGGEHVVTCELQQIAGGSQYRYHYVVRAAATGKVVSDTEGPELYANSVTTSPDGRLLAGIRTVWVVVMSADDFSKPVAELRNDSRKEFTGVAFHPSGKYLASASNDKTIKFWDTRTWAVAKTFTWDAGKMRSIAFSPDGTLAAAGTDNGRVVVWDVDV